MNRFIKRIPVSERGPGVTCRTKSGAVYIVAHNRQRMTFTLYRMIDGRTGGYERIRYGASSPFELYKLVPWNQ